MTSPSLHDAKRHAPQISLMAAGLTDYDLNLLGKLVNDIHGELRIVTTFSEALRVLAGFSGELVVCSRRFAGGDWKSLLKECRKLDLRPSFIVASTAEEKMNHFWLEALNGGVYDVISSPFSIDDVQRTVSRASHDWRICYGTRFRPKAGSSLRSTVV